MARMSAEDRRDNFRRLGTARANKAVDAIRLIGNLSEAGRYDYTQADLDQIFGSIKDELSACEARFKAAGQRRTRKPVVLVD